MIGKIDELRKERHRILNWLGREKKMEELNDDSLEFSQRIDAIDQEIAGKEETLRELIGVRSLDEIKEEGLSEEATKELIYNAAPSSKSEKFGGDLFNEKGRPRVSGGDKETIRRHQKFAEEKEANRAARH